MEHDHLNPASIEVFSSAPYGALWSCAGGARVFVRFGDVVLIVPSEILAFWSDPEAVRKAFCAKCGALHVVSANGHLNIPQEHLPAFIKAAAALLKEDAFALAPPACADQPTMLRH